MKKHWLIALLICSLCVSFSSCAQKEEMPNSGNSDNLSGSTFPQLPPEEEKEPSYGLGQYENENEKQWWTDSSSPEEKEEEISGETIPY